MSLEQSEKSEKRVFHAYLAKDLNFCIQDSFPFEITPNDSRLKRFLGKRVGRIATRIYEIVEDEARRLNIFTYELRSGSRSEKIFLRKEFDFIREDVLWKELVIYLVNSVEDSGH